MAIKNIFARGVGFTGGQIGWVVTRGYGDLTVAGEVDEITPGRGRAFHRIRLMRWFVIALLLLVG